MKKVLVIFASLILIACIAGAGVIGYKKFKDLYDYQIEKIESVKPKARFSDRVFDYSWMNGQKYIAHAMGGIDGFNYTNSKEAFIQNYEKGFRVFEADFDYAEDEYKLFLTHGESDWRERSSENELPYNVENFKKSKLHGAYTTMDLSDLIEIMKDYPDIYVVLDTKHADNSGVILEYSQIVKSAQDVDDSILERMIPQVYTEDMYWTIMEIYPFQSVIYTLYKEKAWTPESVYDFCFRSGIRFVTLKYSLISKEIIALWDTLDIKTAVHTVNDEDDAKQFFEMGVDMIYTDFLEPDAF